MELKFLELQVMEACWGNREDSYQSWDSKWCWPSWWWKYGQLPVEEVRYWEWIILHHQTNWHWVSWDCLHGSQMSVLCCNQGILTLKVFVFTPEKTTLHAVSQLCICTKCMNSCELCWGYWLSAYLRHHTSVIYLVGIQSSFYMCIVFFVWFNEATSYYYEFFKSKPLLVTSFWFFHQKCINKLH